MGSKRWAGATACWLIRQPNAAQNLQHISIEIGIDIATLSCMPFAATPRISLSPVEKNSIAQAKALLP